MKKFVKRINLKYFRNKTHFEFMSEVYAALSSAGLALTKIVEKIAHLAQLLAEEDIAVVQVRKYETTDEIALLDGDRDNVFRGTVNLLKGALRHFDPLVSEAAGRLKIIFDTYGDITRLTYDEETAAIDNLLQELDARPADVGVTGIAAWVEELRRINGELHTLMTARYSEAANRSHLQMRKVRTAVDTDYCDIIYLLEAAVALDDTNPVYEALFAELNARVTRYANIMAQEKGRRKKTKS
ncbi:MAG: DUF6261 family protein [Bacteroidales bacterium]|jgi:hypothetical protein|nr:DUF6261 family protein [Bacteroidales bacterium]